MKNTFYTLLFLSYCFLSHGQVGINILNPQQTLHVDPLKNTLSDPPTTQETEDDFIITKEGNVGIGHINPTAKLEVHGQIKLKDGTQGADKIIVGDANGVMQWKTLPTNTPTTLGDFDTTNDRITPNTNQNELTVYSNVSITLPKGKWIVNLGLTLGNSHSLGIWVHGYLSSSTTSKEFNGFTLENVAKEDTAYATSILGKDQMANGKPPFAMLMGSSIVNVTADSVILYVLLENSDSWSFSTKSLENYLYAIPIL